MPVDPLDFDFEEMFDEDYLFFLEPALAKVSPADCELIWRLLDLGSGSEVLDMACGHGRIANRLAQRGAHVTGLDAAPLFLERARREAERQGLGVDYVEGDMRTLPWPEGCFEHVISWFTSFGFFSDDENRAVLREARRVLRPGGRLLIDVNNLSGLLPRWLPVIVIERDGGFSIDRPRFDPVSGRVITHRTIIRDARTRTLTFSVRMFVAAELRDWLIGAGFATVRFYDNAGEPLSADSRRAIAVATRE